MGNNLGTSQLILDRNDRDTTRRRESRTPKVDPLVSAALSGDREAEKRLCEIAQKKAHTIGIYPAFKRDIDCEDIVQDALLGVICNPEIENAEAYLHTTIRRLVICNLRKRQPLHSYTEDEYAACDLLNERPVDELVHSNNIFNDFIRFLESPGWTVSEKRLIQTLLCMAKSKSGIRLNRSLSRQMYDFMHDESCTLSTYRTAWCRFRKKLCDWLENKEKYR